MFRGSLLPNPGPRVGDPRDQLQANLAERYVLERELGRGGMATVYLAQDLKHDRRVALKLLHPDLAHALGPERFLREIKFAARLQHPHILTLHDSGDAAGQLWYTMPYIEGESLRDRLGRERQLPVGEALQITREVADAVGYAHRQGVIHRDIKPENILLSQGHALVADFGIARAVQTSGGEHLTETGRSVGTPAYMSPEQSMGDSALDGRSDLYSLGCVLYEMLTGETPHSGSSAQAIIAKRLADPVLLASRLRKTIPPAVDQALQRVLAKAPADRFASADEFAQSLSDSASSTPASSRITAAPLAESTLPPGTRRVPRIVIASGFGVLLGLGVLVAWLRTRPGAETTDPKRVAVLPFENVGDPADAYFADGVTDALRGKLAALPNLQVTARSSSSQYKHTAKSPQRRHPCEAGRRRRGARAADGVASRDSPPVS
jgi:eukaryotic-like serine/threonine-protein kinase